MLPGKIYKIMLFFWMTGIWVISSMPAKVEPNIDILNIDKLYHIIVYLALVFLVMKNYRLGLFSKSTKHQIMLILVLLAALDEFHQQFINNRTVSLMDLAANLTGLTAGFFIFRNVSL